MIEGSKLADGESLVEPLLDIQYLHLDSFKRKRYKLISFLEYVHIKISYGR